MDASRPPTPDFWVFQTDRENHEALESLRPGTTGTWTIYGREPELKPGDVAFIFLADPRPSLIGWGFIERSNPFSNDEVDDPFTNKYPYGFHAEIDFQALVTPHVTPAEMRGDPALESLLGLLAKLIRVFKVEPEHARALSKLLRERGIAAPPDPLEVWARRLKEFDAGEGEAPPVVALREALARYQFSPLTQNIVALAGNLAYKRTGPRYLITTSCILFAIVETGEREEEADTSAELLYSWLKERHWQAYNNAFDSFMRGAGAAGGQAVNSVVRGGIPTLTPAAIKVIEAALGIAKFVRRGDRDIDRGVICARDLLAALLVDSEQGETDAADSLASMGVNLPELRERLFSFLSHPTNDEDDTEKWRRLLIEGVALPERAGPPGAAPPAAFLPRIDADDVRGEDRLGIMGEVRGFASIIAARDVRTPLSIGLFGDWGAGKSFFMSKLKEEVARIAGRVRAMGPGEETAFLGNVVQIDFNAWHYAEANLWASLVSHVFENLSLSDEHDRRKAEERKRLLLAQLDSALGARREAESEVAARRREEESARAALERARREQTDATLSLGRALGREVWGLVREQVEGRPEVKGVLEDAGRRLGREGLPANLGELRQEIAAARAAAGQAHGYLSAVFGDPRRWLKVFLLLAAALLVPVVVAHALTRWPVGEMWERAAPTIATLLTLLGGAAAWLRSRRGEVERALSVLGEASRRLDEMYEAARGQHEREVGELRLRLGAKEAAVAAAAGALEEAERGVRETVAALRELEPGAVLERFVTERAASEDYRKLLGVVALIRRDFKKLSDLLSRQDDTELREAVRRKLLKDGEEGGEGPDEAEVERVLDEYRIDRIVLYIDDLDRCPPKQVVDVLQAIHLLLAFELFVVVVGVDARWVRHSLREQFPALLGGGADDGEPHRARAATPRDYIEKIFQVPFWLRPMGREGSADLLLGLIPDSELRRPQTNGREGKAAPPLEGPAGLTAPADAEAPAGPLAARPRAGGDANAPPSPAAAARAEEVGPEALRGASAAAPPAAAAGDGGAFALRPDNLLLEAKERDAMLRLAKVIGRTPRALKRFVNVYRIIKAGLRGERLEAFMGEGAGDGEFRAVLVLLAVAHGAPDAAPFFFRLLGARRLEAAAKNETVGLKSFLVQVSQSFIPPPPGAAGAAAPAPPAGGSQPTGWADIVAPLMEFADDHEGELTLEVLCAWTPVVLRYTFQLGGLSEDFA